MSAFTDFIPGGGGISVAKLAELINAYNTLSSELKTHISSQLTVAADPHSIKKYVDDMCGKFDSLNTSLQSVIDIVSDSKTGLASRASKDDVGTAVATESKQREEALKNYFTKEEVTDKLNKKTDKTELDELSKKLDEEASALKNNWKELYEHIELSSEEAKFKKAVRYVEEVISRIHALSVIDFTEWTDVAAQFAGTGAIEASTNGLYILGALSDDWSDMEKDDKYYDFKSARVHIKYINTAPFDAIVDCVATKTTDDDNNPTWRGKIKTLFSKKHKSWHYLSFHLVHATGKESGTERVYLAVSADGLAASASDYANLHFFVSGINFIPLDDKSGRAPRIQGVLGVKNVFATDNTSLIIVGDNGEEDGIIFTSRPEIVTDDESDSEHGQGTSPLVSLKDLELASCPVGAIIRWPHFEKKTKAQVIEEGLEELYKEHYAELWDITDDNTVVSSFAVNVPEGWHACDGTSFDLDDMKYWDLAKVLPDGKFPVADFSIVHVNIWASEDGKNTDMSDILTNRAINDKIDKEIKERELADTELHQRIDEEHDEHTENERQLQDSLDKEADVREKTDRALAQAIEDERTNRTLADSVLQDHIDEEHAHHTAAEEQLRADLEAEAAERKQADETLQKNLDVEAGLRRGFDDTLDAKISNVKKALELEETTRKDYDKMLGERIDTVEEAAKEEAQVRASEDVRIDTRIDNVKKMITTREKQSKERDQQLSDRIDEEASTRQSYDAALSGRVSTLEGYHKGKEPDDDNSETPMPDNPIPVPGGD